MFRLFPLFSSDPVRILCGSACLTVLVYFFMVPACCVKKGSIAMVAP